ncbi:FitA-like ribbon-helix-helix domain-containing protein [Singulisphaera sp. PoT]|uniref:FitA-like ribbon-helix-helix domain-containing protein n=1 Tax=Singulisphaera sp. PoT TaxID=3411797 RepID=UPI003BF4B8B7
MKEVRIRNVDDWVVEWLRTQAKREGKTLEGELRQILTDSALAGKRALAAELRDGLDEFRSQGRVFADSARLIREDRDTRG